MGPSWTNYHYSPRLVPWLRSNRHKYDAVIVDGLWQYGGLAVHRAVAKTATPYFVFGHGMLDPWFKRTYPLKHLKKWLYWPWGEYRVLRDATGVLFTCQAERRLARQSFWLYRCNERVVNFGTPGPGDASPDQQLALRDSFLNRYPALQGKRNLLFLGRVHVKKGPDLLIKAFAKLLERLPTDSRALPHVVMAGPTDSAYGKEMKELATCLGLDAHVTWTGMLTGDDKWGAFHAADAFVLPSHQENFGIAVAEALACSLPVLISNQVNIWREIIEDSAGYAAADSEEGTLDLLQRWLATPPDDWASMRQQALTCFERRFHIEAAAASLIETLVECGVATSAGADPSTDLPTR